MATPRKQSKAQSLTTPAQPATVHLIRPTVKEGTTTVTDFGVPIPVADMPPKSTRGGRQSNAPMYEKWLAQLVPGQTFELGSVDPDGGHPAGRVTAIRKVALAAYPNVKIETRPIEAGKRYRIFATVLT